MNNADRQLNIIDALSNLTDAPTTRGLNDWLGRPYYFDDNLAALIESGVVVESAPSRYGTVTLALVSK